MSKRHKPATYLLMGYPLASSKADETSQTIFSDATRHVTQIHRGEIDDRDAEADILLAYPVEAIDSDGNKTKVPHPRGISGCRIWRLKKPGKPLALWKPEDKKLVAIEHRWKSKKPLFAGLPLVTP